MGSSSRIRNTVGLLALGASIALASPGVNAVRAEAEGLVAQAAPGGQCSASGPAASMDAEIEAMVEQLRRQQADRNASDGDLVVLNNHGYNYGPPRGIQLDAIQAERSYR
jgi:hypothetical protein